MIDEPILLPEACRDVLDAWSWYEGQSPGLGMEFMRCVEACVNSIRRHPLMYQITHRNFRRSLVRRFPFAVFYEVDRGRIVIYAVFHCAQNPAKWQTRLLS